MSVLQTKLAYVTGSSRGIGKALVESLLNAGYQVIGLSRSNDYEAERFSFEALDLSDLDAAQAYNFPHEADHILLVNNAGMIGEIQAVGNVENESIIKTMNVNTLAPQILTNNFVKRFQNDSKTLHILNISSGAGKAPIDSWATYCASKAALDLFSETVAEELDWRGKSNFTVHSCAPGVVDTQMQSEIRSSDPQVFKHHQKFVDYKNNDDLYTSDYVASKLMKVINEPQSFPQVIISVRDF